MKSIGTYKITRQGQVTIPSEIREKLDLEEGDVLDFFYTDGTIVIRKKREPIEVFKELASETRKRFEEEGITKKDIPKEIEKVRKKQ